MPWKGPEKAQAKRAGHEVTKQPLDMTILGRPENGIEHGIENGDLMSFTGIRTEYNGNITNNTLRHQTWQ